MSIRYLRFNIKSKLYFEDGIIIGRIINYLCVARKGSSKDAVQYETSVHSIALPEAMMRDLVTVLDFNQNFANRTDFIMYAVRRFNDYTLKFIIDNISSKDQSPSILIQKSSEEKEKLIRFLDDYVIDEGQTPRLPYKITYSMTEQMEEQIKLLNENSWRFDSIQTYMRVAIGAYIQELRRNRGNIKARSSVLGHVFVSTLCPSTSKNGSSFFKIIEIKSDDEEDDDAEDDFSDRFINPESSS